MATRIGRPPSQKDPDSAKRLQELLDRVEKTAGALVAGFDTKGRKLEAQIRDWIRMKRAPLPRNETVQLFTLIGIKDPEATADYIHRGKKRPSWWLDASDPGLDMERRDQAVGAVAAQAGELTHRTPPTGTRLREAEEASRRAEDDSVRRRFDELARAVEKKRQRGEPVSDLENQLASLWPRLRQAIEAAEDMFNEADGNRTRNLRIDSVLRSIHALAKVLLQHAECAGVEIAAA